MIMEIIPILGKDSSPVKIRFRKKVKAIMEINITETYPSLKE